MTVLRVVAWLTVEALDVTAGVLSGLAGRIERELL